MNLNELEDALQQINGQLMTEKEMQYVYHVSDLDLLMDIFFHRQTKTHLSVSFIISLHLINSVTKNLAIERIRLGDLMCGKPKSYHSTTKS